MIRNIKRNLIHIHEAHRNALIPTLQMYDRGEDLTESPLIKSRINILHADSWRAGFNEKALYDRQTKFIALYESIKKGYNGTPLWGWFDSNGYLRLYDGFHRVCILEHLGMDIELPVEFDWKGIDGSTGNDFPIENYKFLYQPVDDPRLEGIYIDRPDCPQRLEYILNNLQGKTVFDIGCAEGYFSRELTKRGYKVTSVDINNKNVSLARYLTTLANLKVDYHCGDWRDLLEALPPFDNILFLSVTHNEAKEMGLGKALQKLWAFRDKTKVLFMEVPNMDNERQWNKPGYPNWDFSLKENLWKLEQIIGLNVTSDYTGVRKIHTFSDDALTKLETKHDFSFYIQTDEKFIAPCVKEYQEWEPETTKFIASNLKEGQTFVDVGANVGYFTILASKMVGKTGKVIAFEPASDNLEILNKNLELNNCTNVEVHPVGLSHHEGMAELKSSGEDNSYGERSTEGNGKPLEKIFLQTLDSFDIKPDMIKIDIEGLELDVLKGAAETLKSEPIIVVEDESGETSEFLKDFKEVGQASGWKPLNRFLAPLTKESIHTNGKTVYHLLGLAHTKTNKTFATCAITQNVLKLAQMLTDQGHTVYHYGAEGSEVPCEHIDCVSDELQRATYGDNWHLKLANYKRDDAVYKEFNRNAIREINRRKSPHDILLIMNGRDNKEIADAVKLMTVEGSIGYSGVFADKKVFESYAWMHYIQGLLSKNGGANDGKFYDPVIPIPFDPADFIYSEDKEDYFLYVGRLVKRKGIHIAQQVVDKIGAKLIVVGPGELKDVIDKSDNVEYRGVVGFEERAELMSKAKGLFAPTVYLEPFGAIVIEANMCGTPVITTDWGAFPETVNHGVTGYRCRTFDDFIWAAENIDNLKPKDCREWAVNNYSMNRISLMYEEYFDKVKGLFGKGWYNLTDKKDLDWLRRY